MVHIRREIEIMSSLRHPHIISIYEGEYEDCAVFPTLVILTAHSMESAICSNPYSHCTVGYKRGTFVNIDDTLAIGFSFTIVQLIDCTNLAY